MLDGFRWDYANRLTDSEIPALKDFIANGVSVKGVEPVFPSVSFPSWTSIVTGSSNKVDNL